MTDRVLSQNGNVVAVDFRPRASIEINFEIGSEILYYDDNVMLVLFSFKIAGKASLTYALADMNTGQIVTL